MSRSRIIIGAQIFLLAVLLAGCEKKAADKIDFGTFNNSVYTNNYFGLSATMPADWCIQDEAARQRMMNLGSKVLAGDDKNLKAVISADELQTVSLFAVFKYPLGTAVEFNPSINAMAEEVSQWPGIKTGKDYLFQTKKVLQSGQIQVTFPKEVYTKQLDGVDFDVMESEMSVRGLVIKQKYYSAIRKGYALNLIVSFMSEEDEAALQKILDGVTFK